jgi:hypothetical protein
MASRIRFAQAEPRPGVKTRGGETQPDGAINVPSRRRFPDALREPIEEFGPGLVDGDRGPKVSQRPASNRSRKPRQALLFPPIRLSRLGAEDLRGVAARGVAGSCRRARHTVERRRSRGSSLVPDRDGVSAVERAAEASGVGGLRTARSGDTCAAEPGCCEEGRSDGQCPPHLSKGRRDPAAARSPLRRAGATRFG